MQEIIIERDMNNIQPTKIEHGKIICIEGARGSGKTTKACEMAHRYKKRGDNVFSNITFYNFAYVPIDFNTLREFPSWLKDGVAIMDEMHQGADAYNFLAKSTLDITTMATQIRKHNLTLIYITQDMTQIVKRLRRQTDYLYEVRKIDNIDGVIELTIRDLKDGFKVITKEVQDLRKWFNWFDTLQVILDEKPSNDKKSNKNDKST